MFLKIVILKNLAIFTEKDLCWSHSLIKLQPWILVTFLKETPTKVFSYENWEIFKRSFFIKNLRWLHLSLINAKRSTTASVRFVLVSLLCCLSLNFELLLFTSIFFATLSMYFVDWFNFGWLIMTGFCFIETTSFNYSFTETWLIK